ncbi:hypothetical protein HCN44_004973 [Aphidius gifuensis]|uniref:ACB domain-containing protein n=1 Tax=Aphidius gifuensis TaxID=684658 RepID=A0A835CRA6_APHGI|nr:acyl-CoA-binding protein-like [Aphidius gifuensis]KAF7992629.1 hypothetical protein HCN44_004973 [Aphidius gifuensis]
MGIDQDFDKAAEDVKDLTKRPSDEELLELYALFKQATVGDVTGSRPGMLDLKGKAKFDKWSTKKGTSKEDAKKAYIAHANTIIQKYK